ncbi:uncharacterized protein BT62DRAFT_898209 [Guyanagaster necrorhizus]|uniref:GAR domain-containing protein n=1 Tax=Guyanagaster necrorhizus TaxID=856835 RepID=A0A9P8ASM3_9AGAR|nr:uncharacterized protein BT62DRAFT_898209 [Guyanagaster necrorhizus MCA 3950]KAG7445012.1 hypothetical protein BT62DRAFT_898209 [Guyanagaster necrorhizus MCA 3950]
MKFLLPSRSAVLPALVVSSQLTATSLIIADIQARIFSIQELRHKSHESGDATGTTNTIDQSLMALDAKLEAVSKEMKFIGDAMVPLLQVSSTPTFSENGEASESAMIIRKHATLVADWENVQNESDTLREELKEDKWLTVFRTVTDQADGMMSSLEKAVNRCQDFIWKVYRRDDLVSHFELPLSSSNGKDSTPPNLEVFSSLLDSFEAKKKHYMPATSKVLSIIDKGVRDRVTKNGETLRRHSESAQRWRNLRERITRTDAEMEAVRKLLLSGDAFSEGGSSHSGTPSSSQNGYLMTPPSGSRSSRAPSATSTLSRSISPLRKFARKITRSSRQSQPPAPVTPVTPLRRNGARTPASEPVLSQASRQQRTNLFSSVRGGQLSTSITPERPGHKYSQSLTPDPSPRNPNKTETIGRKGAGKAPWNSSTKVVVEERMLAVKGTPTKRTPSAMGIYNDLPPIPTPSKRSVSRASMASSRPWSPLTSSVSTSQSSNHPPMPTFRPPSRAQTPSRAFTPGPAPPTPRPRPRTPSHIPAPSHKLQSFGLDGAWDDNDSNTTLVQRAISPSTVPSSSVNSVHPPRPPSRSMIPLPTVHLSSPTRPSTSLSSYGRESPTGTFRAAATRAQTPESTLRSRVMNIPIYHGTMTARTPRPRAPSRSGSRAGAYTPGMDNPIHEYVPGNPKDPLDVEVGIIVNSIPHGLLVERVDPPLKKIPKDGEEVKAQYSFSNALSKKVVTCRLTTLTRLGKGTSDTTKKVMCRVGGGWQDLSHYILNRQAGM